MIAKRRDVVSVQQGTQERDPGIWLLALMMPLTVLGGWLAQFI